MLSNNTKLATLGLLLITGAVLWVISPARGNCPADPCLASTLPHGILLGSTWHCSLVLMPVVFFALLDAVVTRIRYGVVPRCDSGAFGRARAKLSASAQNLRPIPSPAA